MPELPEVETVRRGLEPTLKGAEIQSVLVRRANLREPIPADLKPRLEGARIRGLRRRSKYILIDTDRDDCLLVHLGMSGRVTIVPAGTAPTKRTASEGGEDDKARAYGKHDHIILTTTSGAQIIYTDPRRFGIWALFPASEEASHRLLAHIGPEPLSNSFHSDHLASVLRARKSPIKTSLLDQRLVAGLGNIYVCEALWRSRIHPARPANSLTAPEIETLTAHIKDVLTDAINAGGSSLKDYRGADGELGYFQHQFDAYGREGDACKRTGCDGTLERITQSGRSTFYCGGCQL